MEVVSHTFAGPVCLRVFLKAAGAIDCCHIYIKPLRAHHLTGGLWPSGLYWRVPDQPQVSVRVQTALPQPTVQAVSLPSSFYLGRWSVPMTPMSITPHHFLQKASTCCGSPVRQQPIFQGTFCYEDQILSHLPASAGGHNNICFFCFHAGDIIAPQNEPEKYAGVVERTTGLEAVRGSLCQSKLSAVLEEVHQNTTTFNRQAKNFKYRFLLCFVCWRVTRIHIFLFHLSEYILLAATDGQWKEASKALSTDHPTRKDKIRVSGAVQHPSLWSSFSRNCQRLPVQANIGPAVLLKFKKGTGQSD